MECILKPLWHRLPAGVLGGFQDAFFVDNGWVDCQPLDLAWQVELVEGEIIKFISAIRRKFHEYHGFGVGFVLGICRAGDSHYTREIINIVSTQGSGEAFEG